MGKKIRAEMDAQRKTFVDGATGRGIPEAKAVEVFELMAKFADYGFNKSHAAAYALVSYQTAWMKTNHPVAFLAACMSLAISNTDKLAALRQEAERLGIRVLPPDINRSGADFTVDVDSRGQAGDPLRAGCGQEGRAGGDAVPGVGAGRPAVPGRDGPGEPGRSAAAEQDADREPGARRGVRCASTPNRAQLFAGADQVLRRAQADAEQKESGQIGLFGGAAPQPIRLPAVPDWPKLERLGFEAEAIGFHLTAHPLDMYAALLKRIGAIGSGQLEAAAAAGVTRVKLAGCVIGRKERPTRTGSKMAWVRLSDAAGSYEVTFFSETLAAVRRAAAGRRAHPGDGGPEAGGRGAAHHGLRGGVAGAGGGGGRGGRARLAAGERRGAAHPRDPGARAQRPGPGGAAAPVVGEGQDVEIELPGGFNVTPQLAQALKHGRGGGAGGGGVTRQRGTVASATGSTGRP